MGKMTPKELIQECGAEVEIIFANDPRAILPYTKHVLCCDIHTRQRTKRLLKSAGAERVFGLDEILNAPVNSSGYNEKYGLLGSNKATEEQVKLFPRDCLFQGFAGQFGEVVVGQVLQLQLVGGGALPAGKRPCFFISLWPEPAQWPLFRSYG